MSWQDLLFAHWPIDPTRMRERVPPQLTVETFEGVAWVGVVPFLMSNTRPRFSPVALASFPELNVRTYVSYGGKSGIYFFSLDAANALLVWGARTFARLPYYNAAMHAGVDEHGWTRFASTRVDSDESPARFAARYRPTGPAAPPKPNSLEHFLTERYCLYTLARGGEVLRCEVHHGPWPLQPAEAEVELDTMLEPIHLLRPDTPPRLHFARSCDARVWWPAQADE